MTDQLDAVRPDQLDETTLAAASEAAGEPSWLRDRRLEALKAFTDRPWPHGKLEEWRYTDPERFDHARPLVRDAGEPADLAGGVVEAARAEAGPGPAAWATLVDGGVVDAGVRDDLDGRVAVADLREAAGGELGEVVREHLGSAVGADDKLEALSLAAFTSGVVVHVADGEVIDGPVLLRLQVSRDGAHLPRVLVVLGERAQAQVVVERSGDAEATVVEVAEVVVGPGAVAGVCHAQQWGERVDHVGVHRGVVARDGDLRALEVSLGGRTLYVRPDATVAGEGANADVLGCYLCDGSQHVEHRSLIHHTAERTTSELVFKGALQGTSQSVFFGNLKIEPHARGTSTDQTNRNLILTDGAKADTIPFLEIECSDILRCGHASTVGQLDAEQITYLRSRGIPPAEAVRMLVLAFFGEVTERAGVPGVGASVLDSVEQRIGATTATLAEGGRG